MHNFLKGGHYDQMYKSPQKKKKLKVKKKDISGGKSYNHIQVTLAFVNRIAIQ